MKSNTGGKAPDIYDIGNQGIAILARILHNRTCRPLATTSDWSASPLPSHLARKLIHRRIVRVGMLHRVHYRLADEQWRFSVCLAHHFTNVS